MSTIAVHAATAVIQFIGLFVFSRGWSEDGHLQAIAPRISQSDHAHAARPARVIALDVPVERNTEVEPHVTIIAFPACSYIESKGWAPMAFENAPGFLYVRLNGERVKFSDSVLIAAPEVTRAAGRLRTPILEEPLNLPHLNNCFKGMGTLKKGFAPPWSASAAIGSKTTAVFDFPDGSGTARACKGKTDASGILSRIDTLVTKNIAGDLIISAENMNKYIQLKGDTHVLVANIEASFVDPVAAPGGSADHYDVYFAMGLANSGLPQYGDPTLNDFGCAKTLAAKIGACTDESAFREMSSNARIVTPGMVLRVDYECSNTQWP